jgi:hypothetical protein
MLHAWHHRASSGGRNGHPRAGQSRDVHHRLLGDWRSRCRIRGHRLQDDRLSDEHAESFGFRSVRLMFSPSSLMLFLNKAISQRKTFATPADPTTADLATLQNQLNDYLAVEAGVRVCLRVLYTATSSSYRPCLPCLHRQSNGGGAILNPVKSVKFFLQFQVARVQTAQGVTLGVADTVAHQLGKVIKVRMVQRDAIVEALTCLPIRMQSVRARARSLKSTRWRRSYRIC